MKSPALFLVIADKVCRTIFDRKKAAFTKYILWLCVGMSMGLRCAWSQEDIALAVEPKQPPSFDVVQQYTENLYYFPQTLQEDLLLLETNEPFIQMVQEGLSFFKDEEYDKARGVFLESLTVVQKDPLSGGFGYMLLLLSYTYLLDSAYDQARTSFKETVGKCSRFLQNARNNPSSMPEQQHIEQVSHVSVMASYMLHRIEQMEGNYTVAAEGYEKLLSMAIAKERDGDIDGFYEESRLLESIHYRLGECLLIMGKYEEGMSYLEFLIEKINDSFFQPYARYMRGIVYESQLKVVEALAEYRQIDSKNEMYVDSLLAQAVIHRNSGSQKTSISLYKKVARKYPNHPRTHEALYALGVDAYENRKWKRVVDYLSPFKNAYLKEKQRPHALRILGEVYLEQKNQENYNEVMSLMLASYDEHLLTGALMDQRIDLWRQKGNIEKARLWLDGLMNDPSLSQVAQETISVKLEELSQSINQKEAEGDYVTMTQKALAVEENPEKKSQLLYELGNYLVLQNRLKEAEQYYQQGFRNNVNGVYGMRSLLGVAKIQMMRGNDMSVELSVEKIIHVYPEKEVSSEAMLELVKYYETKNKHEQVENILQKIILMYPKSKEASASKKMLKKKQ